ncbi:uncharacterized protein TRIADDRAFT_24378 [Trichoplax adhaerens]|uniref:Abasic site processing protein HMCES n=1 Tax=Trichoplax adhaerens TaxID=10228 RepID=B3RVM1_TRIAD|nr:hypothetical protein TRIADDRAFT_24378 [Trichoplax adhaerens]EDV25524.1 hypothetical protein TRIADDRAFT_24378 [Trichoplax adhaerens]|eukprot:XP_002111557.1 hypothetical protein TRIADDRAFT_24378 [Trichoplax adhaerens]
MCGRTACTLPPSKLRRACRYKSKDNKVTEPRWKGGKVGRYYTSPNVAPMSWTPVLLSAKHAQNDPDVEGEKLDSSDRMLQVMRWGLVPAWYKKDLKSFNLSTNNCRSDGMLDKRMFSTPLNRGRRCVVLADGYYEWKTTKDKQKIPHLIFFKNDVESSDAEEENDEDDQAVNVRPRRRVLTMAGVFEIWHPPKEGPNDPIYAYSIITVDASPAVSGIHHRMPAILDGDEAVSQWLDYENVPLSEAANLIKPLDTLEHFPVSSCVNNSRNKSLECMVKIEM